MSEPCLICRKPVADYEPQICCYQRDCACQGQPINPCTCSVECDKALFDHIGKTFDERRQLAGIELWSAARTEGTDQ